jgi:competence protein ComEA
MDLNTASADDLARVPSIGGSRARKIVRYREENGPFESVDELCDVDGFGDTLKADLRSALTVGRTARSKAA